MARTLAAVANELDVRLIGEDASFGSVSIDTRELDDGDLFVAVKGENFDGNDFVADAHAKGAAGALVTRRAEIELRGGDDKAFFPGEAGKLDTQLLADDAGHSRGVGVADAIGLALAQDRD